MSQFYANKSTKNIWCSKVQHIITSYLLQAPGSVTSHLLIEVYIAYESCQSESENSRCGPEDAGVQLAPVPVFLLACVGNLEDARELLVWFKLQVCIWNLTLCSFLPVYNAWWMKVSRLLDQSASAKLEPVHGLHRLFIL